MLYWIIAGNGQAYGPADLALIHKWVAERRIISTTQVSTSEHGPWRDAALIPELARAFGNPDYGAPAPATHADSFATQPASTPPTGPSTAPSA
ncbi:MAG: GYF domain-containing protein [Planctomycetota bacterium]